MHLTDTNPASIVAWLRAQAEAAERAAGTEGEDADEAEVAARVFAWTADQVARLLPPPRAAEDAERRAGGDRRIAELHAL